MIITLNKAEQQLAINLALSRYENARKNGKPNTRIGGQPDWMTDLEGIGGEIAACRFFRVYPDTEVELVDLPKYDLVTRKGAKVDVKTTKYPNGKLLATLKKKKEDCDMYVLVVGVFPTYEMKGYATAEELIRDENIGDLGHGQGYIMEQARLQRFGG